MTTVMRTVTILALSFASVVPLFASKKQWLAARIVSRQDTVQTHSGVVPGRTRASCSTDNNGNATCTETDTPSHVNSYSVGGAKFRLEFADGYVDVFCTSKYALRGDYVNARSCRKPFGQDVEVMFVDRNRQAKLRWTTDGKHYESETYFVAAVQPKSGAASPQLAQSAPPPAAPDSDVFYWFDEVPGPDTQVKTVIITAKAYDHILTSLRNIRGGDTAVRVGPSILDLNYHPASLAISAFAPDLSIVFHWNDEPLTNATPGFSTRVTKRTFEEITKLIPELRADVYTKHDIEPQEN